MGYGNAPPGGVQAAADEKTPDYFGRPDRAERDKQAEDKG
jgi:hypothetical protein